MILFETERLLVRRFTLSDAESFFLLNSNARVMQFIRPVKNREECDAFLAANINFYLDTSVLGRFGVFEKESGCFLGAFSYLYLAGESDFHLGYALLPEAWGKGYATELVKSGLDYFFKHSQQKEVFAITEKEHLASQKVLYKAGFLLKGEHKEEEKNLLLFRFQSDWLSMQGGNAN